MVVGCAQLHKKSDRCSLHW